MLENARRQLMLVILIAVGAIVALYTLPLNRGLDLSGGVQLIYEVDVAAAQLDGSIPENANDAEIRAILDETVKIINERIDPQGTTEAVVTRKGETGILIELPKMTDTETVAVEARIENLGRLEFRMLATDAYRKDGVTFSMKEERQRLREWLTKDDGANRKLVAEKPEAIRSFNALAAESGGPQSRDLAWYPHLLKPKPDAPSEWSRSLTANASGMPEEENLYGGVPAFLPEDWNQGRVRPEVPFLVELLPVNMHESHFTGEDLEPTYTRPGIDQQTGRPCIHYKMRVAREGAYADWSDEFRNQCSAIILNDVVYSAPRFENRILGAAQITGDFTKREVDELVKTLRTGSLKVKPIRQSRAVIGATLGEHSIRLALISMAVGALLTLVFILAYYRRAGLVAFAALALNILLILATVVLIRATLTLPGLAGLVLTMGMAVDANILIYERIREELARGKEMLQACRTGFDRAIVTIIDANLTTFIAGLVLYQFGVGPIRGFAVTLMVGILTTLFTAFFVSRLVFHYLLETNRLKEFKVANWFREANFNFLGWWKGAITVSVVVIVAGLIAFVLVSNDRKYAIDFTGGANLHVVLREPMTANEMRQLLATGQFGQEFPGAMVNTVDEKPDNTATQFGVRIKLDEATRTRIDQERNAKPDGYVAPYVVELRELLKNKLVPDAFSDARVYEDVEASANANFADIQLHFTNPIETATLKEGLKGIGGDVGVSPTEGKPSPATDFLVEFSVPKGTKSDLLFSMVQNQLSGLTDAAGQPISLSNPIPESAEIGGRMVGELRSSAVNALFVAMFGIVMYIRVRFHEYKYGIAAVLAVLHDVLVTLGAVVVFNRLGIVDCEIDLSMIAAFLTIIGYSINDTIVIFDRVRENLSDAARLGIAVDRVKILNDSINQTLSRTILTTATTMAVIVTQFIVNFHAGTALEGFSFALLIGMISGTYSTVFIASPIVLWLWNRERETPAETHDVAAATASTP